MSKVNTPLANRIDSAENKKMTDGRCKKLTANRQILAYLLKASHPGFKNLNINEIVKFYLNDPINISGDDVLELKQEMIQDNDHKNIFDIRFIARGEEETVEVDVELQGVYDPGYPLVKRGLVYCGTILSNQLGTVIQESNYQDVHKALVIIVCLDPPKKLRHSIQNYYMNYEGPKEAERKDYDLIQVKMYCLGESTEERNLSEDEEKVLNLLDTLYSTEMKAKEKRRILEEEYGIEMTREVKEEISMASDVWKAFYNRGEENKTIQYIKNVMEELDVDAYKAMKVLRVPSEEYDYYLSRIE